MVLGRVGRAPAVALWGDPKGHVAEGARVRAQIVAGPGDGDCSIWVGSIGADGYGLYITRQGRGLCVRPHRYALALATGEPSGTTLALHECDIPFLGGFQRVAAASRGGGCPREQHRGPR